MSARTRAFRSAGLLALCAAVPLAAWLGPAAGRERPATSDPTGRVYYSHLRHESQGMPCDACHRYPEGDPAPGAEVPALDFTRPEEIDCVACHPFEHPDPPLPEGVADPAVCGLCHPVDDRGKVALPMVAPRFPSLDFDHRGHQEASGAACEACHDPAQIDAGRPPGMRRCLTCHEDALDAECGRCHLHDARGLLQTTLPDGRTLLPPDWMQDLAHTPDFERSHGPAARTKREVCARCHEETFCQGCHLGQELERRFHGAGWTTIHGPASRSSDLDCETCHRGQDRCLTCHRRAGASMDSPEIGGDVPRGRSYHGEAWARDDGLHAREARRNLNSCVSCHSETDCLSCHRVLHNPHGAGFGSRCRRLREVQPETCVRCHTGLVPPCS